MKQLIILFLLAFSLSAAGQKPVEDIWIFKVGQSSIEVTNNLATSS